MLKKFVLVGIRR